MQRIGIFGGTFDPIHNGHLLCARHACQAAQLDSVLFTPVATPAFPKHTVSSAEHRLEMCRLAVAENPCFEACDYDIVRGGVTYSIDTVNDIKADYPDGVELFFIVGTDAADALPYWRAAQRLSKLAHFIVVARPGFAFSREQQAALQQAGFDARVLLCDTLDASSTHIRARVARGQSIADYCPEVVCAYIAKHKLYQEK